MCGNGLRCAALYLGKESVVIESLATLHHCEKNKERIAVSMGIPKQLYLDSGMHIWDTGVPHAIFFVDDVATVDVFSLGRQVRYNPLFAPGGVNVTFVQETPSALYIRTYERGVEEETLSCGTGATAAAIAAHVHKKCPLPLRIMPPSEEPFDIEERNGELMLTGSVHEVFTGEITI